MMYWMPRRRTIACLLPYLSVANSHANRLLTAPTSRLLETLTPQSHARPSLCSLRPPTSQPRTMPRLRVHEYVRSTWSRNATTPGLAVGLQIDCGEYGAYSS